MSCRLHRTRFTEFLDDALAPNQRIELERHLESCSDCARELSKLQATIAALGTLPAQAPPPVLRRRVLEVFVEHHERDAASSVSDSASRRRARLSPGRAWALSVGAIAASFLLSLASGPGTELDQPGAPKLCLPVIAVAGLLPAIALLATCLQRRRRVPVSLVALSAAAGALAGQVALFVLCPMLDSRIHALVLHTGALTAITLLGALLGLAQRLYPAD